MQGLPVRNGQELPLAAIRSIDRYLRSRQSAYTARGFIRHTEMPGMREWRSNSILSESGCLDASPLPQCNSRLEMRPPGSFLSGPLVAPLFVLARQGRIFERVALVFAFATIFLIVFESLKPKSRLRRKAPAKPAIWLKIDRPAN